MHTETVCSQRLHPRPSRVGRRQGRLIFGGAPKASARGPARYAKKIARESSRNSHPVGESPTKVGHARSFSYNEPVGPNPAARVPLESGVSALATGEVTPSTSHTVPQLPNHKVKVKKAGQRACNEKDAKGKFCGGHLKRWFYTTDVKERECGDIEKAWGANAEVYRCENCKALYLPAPGESNVNVAGQGMISVFGLTLPPKEK